MASPLQGDEGVVLLTTVGTDADARRLAKALVAAKLVACVSVIPGVRSCFRWKGEICEEEEFVLLIKTRREQILRVRETLISLHPYEVPEFLALPVLAGSPDYMRWLREATTDVEEGGS